MECSVHSIPLNKYVKYFDGQWQGMIAASDGACYFGASTHSPRHGCSFFKFEPANNKLSVLAEDMTQVCGEDRTKTPPQGKIHSPIVEFEGWLYFTTHLSNYWDEAMDKYTGAHVMGYELSTGKFRDFGIVRKRYTIYSAINVDRVHRKLYVLAVPFARADVEKDGSHLYQIDIESGEMVHLGLVGQKQRGCSFWFFIDNEGNCWFTLWKNHWPLSWDHGDLYQFDAKAKAIKCYKDVLPGGKLAPDGISAPAKLNTERSWSWAEALPGNRQCLFTTGCLGGGDERLWIFDPRKNIETGEAFQPFAYIGSTFLANAFDQKDRLYFVQYKKLEDARVYWAEAARDYPREDIEFDDALHLRSISVDPAGDKTVTDHGRIVDGQNRRVTMIESLAADSKGNVYMHGTWDSLTAEESTHQYVWPELTEYYDEMGYSPLLKTYTDAKNYDFKVMHRGQFFSHVNVVKNTGRK
ncbi:MAG: hypothetical protein JSV89_06220 [Spirochaetaceae bacterium]|nr:MAG: hypothetical protein JSV89_06220 [Spirochaetaceae bacterium]